MGYGPGGGRGRVAGRRVKKERAAEIARKKKEERERKIRERGETTSAPVARHSWLAKQSSADLESEFRDAADESTSLLHRPRSRFDTGQFSFRDAAQ